MNMLPIKLGFFIFLAFSSEIECQVTTTDLLTGGGCGRTVQQEGGIVVSHQPFDTIPPIGNDFVCYLQMRSLRRGQTVRFMFSFFSLSPNDCSMANLTFYNGVNESFPEVAFICPDQSDVLTREYVSTGRWLTLKLLVSSVVGTRSANFSGFFVSYTSNMNPCPLPDLQFLCTNGRCIYQILQCDGLNSCSDNSDESPMAPSFCDTRTTTAVTATTTGALVTPSGLFSDLTPLYIILTISFALLLAYAFYIMLSFAWFTNLVNSCLYRCFLFGIRRRRLWKEESEAKSRQNGKIHPESDPDKPMTLEDVTNNESG